jgi:hypothetical protein
LVAVQVGGLAALLMAQDAPEGLLPVLVIVQE